MSGRIKSTHYRVQWACFEMFQALTNCVIPDKTPPSIYLGFIL